MEPTQRSSEISALEGELAHLKGIDKLHIQAVVASRDAALRDLDIMRRNRNGDLDALIVAVRKHRAVIEQSDEVTDADRTLWMTALEIERRHA